MNDEDDTVAVSASKALENVIEYSTTLSNKIPDEVICQIVMAMLNRAAQSLTKGTYEQADKILQNLADSIDTVGSMVINQLPDIIKLLTQIMFSDVTENVKYRAVYIFETICASCDRIRKHLQEIISQFIRDCIVPNIAMK